VAVARSWSKIDRIARSSLPEAVDRGSKQIAEEIADVARLHVPVRSGALKSSIHVRRDRQHLYTVVAGNEVAFYGGFQEYGTEHHRAQPFMRPALMAAAEKGDETIALELWHIDGVERV